MHKEITVEQLNKFLDDGTQCQVIDVREFSEFNSERIDGARLIPLSEFDSQSENIDGSKPVYLMCRSGTRAGQAAGKLLKKGFTDIHVIKGGMIAWSNANLPVIKGDSQVWSLERQVRFAAGFLVLTGILLAAFISPYLILISAFIGAGLMFSAATDTCAMGMVIAKMPWNKAPAVCNTADQVI